MSTTPRVNDIMVPQSPTSQLQIFGAKIVSNMLYRILLAFGKYYCVKCLVLGRRIFWSNVVRG